MTRQRKNQIKSEDDKAISDRLFELGFGKRRRSRKSKFVNSHLDIDFSQAF